MTRVADLSIMELERRAGIARRAIESSAGLLSSRQVAEILGCSDGQLSRWLLGQAVAPDGLPLPVKDDQVISGCRRSNRPRIWIAAEVLAFARRRELAEAGEALCEHCAGTGRRKIGRPSEAYTVACSHCSGQGTVSIAPPPAAPPSKPCPHCNGVGYTLGYRTGGGITPGMRPDVRHTCAWCRGLRRVRLEDPKPPPAPPQDKPKATVKPSAQRPRLVRARDLIGKAPRGAVSGATSPQDSAPPDFAGQRTDEHRKDAA